MYIEDMQKLSEMAPDVYESFLEGKFSVKHTPGLFRAVGADMCLEQTINRSQKSNAGIIGSSKKKQFVAQWEMIYHEMLSVSNLYREVSGVKTRHSEFAVNHEFISAETNATERKLENMMSYIQSHENSANVSSETDFKLHNILTQEIMTEEIRKGLLNVMETGQELYDEFRKERYADKSKRLSDTIHRTNLKTFQSIHA
jgi:uncharacterized membrane-anchored protein YjiN (DUF445 family)